MGDKHTIQNFRDKKLSQNAAVQQRFAKKVSQKGVASTEDTCTLPKILRTKICGILKSAKFFVAKVFSYTVYMHTILQGIVQCSECNVVARDEVL